MAIDIITGRTRAPATSNTVSKADVDSGNKVSTKQAEKSDSIAITAMAQGLKKTIETSSFGSVVDVDRVAAVKKSLADGTYQINPEKIAGKMIEHEKLMAQNDKTRKW